MISLIFMLYFMKRRTENNLEMLFLTRHISTFAGGGREGDELLGVIRCARGLCSTCIPFLTAHFHLWKQLENKIFDRNNICTFFTLGGLPLLCLFTVNLFDSNFPFCFQRHRHCFWGEIPDEKSSLGKSSFNILSPFSPSKVLESALIDGCMM